MIEKKEKRGGYRPTNPGGRPRKADKRVKTSVQLEPDVNRYRQKLGRSFSNVVNELLRQHEVNNTPSLPESPT